MSMKLVQAHLSTDTYIRGLLTKQISVGLLVGYISGDTCYILNVLKFKYADNLTRSIVESISYICQGFTVLGFFVVSADDPKDALRKLCTSIPVEAFPRPILFLHFYTKTSKLSVKEVFIENREERNRPVDYKEIREMPSAYNFISSKVSIQGLYPTAITKNNAGIFSPKSHDISKYFPVPSTVIFNGIGYNEKKLTSGHTKNLSNLLISAAQNRDISEDSEESHTTVVALPVSLTYDQKCILPLSSQLLSSYSSLHHVTGYLHILGATFPTDTNNKIIKTLQNSMIQSITLFALDHEIDNTINSISTRPSDIVVVFVSSNSGIPIPFILPAPDHPKYQYYKDKLENIFDLASPLLPSTIIELQETMERENVSKDNKKLSTYNVSVKCVHTSYVSTEIIKETNTNNSNIEKTSTDSIINKSISIEDNIIESTGSNNNESDKTVEELEVEVEEEEEEEEEPILTGNTAHQHKDTKPNVIKKKSPAVVTSGGSKDKLIIILMIVGLVLIVLAVVLKLLTSSSGDTTNST